MKTMKRTLCLLLALMTLCSLCVGSASAASTTPYDALSSSRYAKVYTLATSGRQTVYTKSNLKTPGNSTGNHLHFEVYNPNNHSQVINPWVTWYQGKISVTIGGNSYRANSKYPNDTTAKAWCNWLSNNCTKNSSGNYVFTA